jgi:YD repeat-containing protein
MIPFLLALTIIATSALPSKAAEPVEKVRKWSRSFPLNAKGQPVSVDNRFGTLRVLTWDREEAKVEITITAKARSESEAEKLADEVEVRTSHTEKGLSVATRFQEVNISLGNGRRGQSVRMDMTVTLPSTQPLRATNKFGNLLMPDYRGPVELTSHFGKLEAGNLAVVTRIDVEFGSLDVEGITGGEGRVEIDYAKGVIRNLSGSVDLRLSFTGDMQLGLTQDLRSLHLRSSYSNTTLEIPADFHADIDMTTSFGKFRNDTRSDLTLKANKQGPGQKRADRYRLGKGGIPIRASSEFGNITLRERKGGVEL